MATVEEKIRNIRELKNLTQEYMAEKLGITQAGYSKIENGTTVLTYAKLIQIAKILEINIEDIIAFDSQKYFNSFNNVKGNNNGSITITTDNTDFIKSLYEDKIQLLQKLLEKTEAEVDRYRNKFGDI
ncbi:helix-turn-helix domain-containing protein [Flavobacterium sp. NRK1]|uniref:helix-turn-helix domain-containing protein n=1 Tax=Flavobacterium sp. NRK1 TaxID=2954929 RepID=UPI002093CCA9|nr:helix-turn-helix transcriptional regulator [Flavobacterium sp. NRK1]MCO6149334.1 helix-turn-helix domain-containing protein [Flavobacterium sp. NRK1]